MENNTNFQTFHQMGAAINDFVKQATGRDNVQNIDIDHITVAQNHYYEDVDVSGSVVSFHAGAAGLPLEKCVVQIEPVQDLHGYDHPWHTGGMGNLLPMAKSEYIVSSGGLTIAFTNDGYITINGTSNDVVYIRVPFEKPIPAGEYTACLFNQIANSEVQFSLRKEDQLSTGFWFVPRVKNAVYSTTISSDAYYWQIQIATGKTLDNYSFSPMLVAGSTAPTTYYPYSNICPIIGWTGANVYVSPTTDAADGQTYTIVFPSEAGTVYGGTLDVVSGKLVVDRMNIASYNGETLPGKWFSDRDVYVEGATPTTGAQVVYELATPITYQLTPTEITTLLGVNNIWADTGDIEVKFKYLKELY